jgi:hypothetical protein
MSTLYQLRVFLQCASPSRKGGSHGGGQRPGGPSGGEEGGREDEVQLAILIWTEAKESGGEKEEREEGEKMSESEEMK